ncbi:MFS transporter [Actinoplanes couchii]|uniref:MFS transporter n=1 Tax=Actinoplanes couchii TaxID=403638 RepID=A0ABQ3XK32_9ACTN|nr:MFS transporter [Actinoplanes couchii]MDR6320447.1 Na+/melibiose symporter-like transporter [Actinoplanes couchii]GID58850.1 MFS transporter [Actinoplanes couchii]
MKLRRGDLIAYATGSVGMGVWVTVPGLLLLYFLTHTLGVPPLLAGLTLLLPKIVDILIHPYLGNRSDHAVRRSGNRLGMLRFGLLLAVAMVGMFTVPPGISGVPAALWVGGWFIIGNLLFACFQVPYLTTPSDLDVGYHERTRIFTFRMLLLTVGLLGAGVAAPALVAAGGRGDYGRRALLLSGVMVVSGLIAVIGVRRLTRDRVVTPDAHSPLALAWRDRDFRALVLSYLCTGTTTHLFLAALPFYTEYLFGDTALTAVFMGAFLGPAVVALPVWFVVSRRIGKQRGLVICQTVFVVGSPLPLLGYGVVPAVVVVAVLGIAFAGLQLFAFAMLPDAVAAASAPAGSYTGVWTATEATGTAIGPYVYSAVLAAGGFAATTEGHTVTQTASAHTALLLGFTVVPAIFMAVALFFQLRWTLDRPVTAVDIS